jgi:hypothetical protein
MGRQTFERWFIELSPKATTGRRMGGNHEIKSFDGAVIVPHNAAPHFSFVSPRVYWQVLEPFILFGQFLNTTPQIRSITPTFALSKCLIAPQKRNQ